uniref:Secreted protein n=1 Tax=Physcomitrium patens TaxID=3218 RepID=A0A2K1IC74_PHYPA|nr:hypothetical protein PHYPA_030347 [Physcomitrium patens]
MYRIFFCFNLIVRLIEFVVCKKRNRSAHGTHDPEAVNPQIQSSRRDAGISKFPHAFDVIIGEPQALVSTAAAFHFVVSVRCNMTSMFNMKHDVHARSFA